MQQSLESQYTRILDAGGMPGYERYQCNILGIMPRRNPVSNLHSPMVAVPDLFSFFGTLNLCCL